MPATVLPRRAGLLLWGGAWLSVLLTAAAATWFTHDRLAAAADAGARQVAGHAAGAVVSLNRALLGVDQMLAASAQAVRAAADDGPLPADRLMPVLAALSERTLLLDGVSVVDADGWVRHASRPHRDGHRLALAPGFADAVLAQATPGMRIVVPPPVPGQADAMLHAARALRLPGGPDLLVVAELPVALLATLLGPAVDTPGLVVTLVREGGEVVATDPPTDPTAAERGVVAPVDLLQAARPTLYPPLEVQARLPLAEVLARPRQERAIVLAAVLLIAALSLGGAALSRRTVVGLAEARGALASSKVLLDQALASMAEGFLLCDADTRVVTWNARYAELFPWLRPVLRPGVPYATLADTAIRALKPQATDAERQAWVEHRLSLHRRADGVWQQDLGNGIVVRGMDRRMPDGGTVSVFHDFTAEERRLEDARRAAETANEAKSMFLANVSHEIRTPLNAVLGLAGVLLGTSLDARQRQHVELMRSSGRNLLAIINDILDATQIEAGRMRIEAIDFDPRQTLQDVVSLLEVRAQTKGLALRLHCDDALPARLRGDPGRLRQVLFNLVGNAIKFTEQGQVELLARAEAPGLVIDVRDTGIGIPADRLDHVFERFAQADASTRRRYGGSGLGLAITRDIVQLMGGQVQVRSHLGQGTVFRVELPFEARPPATAPAPLADDDAPAGIRPQRILVAEDNAVNQIVIQAMLEQLGHCCDIVANGVEAVRQVQAAHYDLVLMDVQMPELDGEAATRAIRALPGAVAAVPIVAMTANAQRDDRQSYRRAGMNGFVGKPVELAQLSRAIRTATARAAAESADTSPELQAG